MAVGHVQNWTGVSGTAGSLAITGTAVTAGNWMMVATKVFSGVTVTPPSPFTSVLSVDNAVRKLQVFLGKAVGGETSFTFTESGTNMRLVLTEFSNILATNPQDVTASTSTASAQAASTGTTLETAQADSMAVAFIDWDTSAVTSPACADSFTLGAAGVVGSIALLLAWKVLSATGTQTGSWTWVSATTSNSAIVVLKGLAPGGGGNGSAQWTEQERRRR